MTTRELGEPDNITRRIFIVRGQRVMLDADLAALYGVETKALNRAVRRNLPRFPSDFMLQLTAEEEIALRCQFGTLKQGRGQHRKYRPTAFTEHGSVMLAAVLHSRVAIEASVRIARAFVMLRQVLSTRRELAKRLDEIERRLAGQDSELGRHRKELQEIFEAIRQLMQPESQGASDRGAAARRVRGFRGQSEKV